MRLDRAMSIDAPKDALLSRTRASYLIRLCAVSVNGIFQTDTAFKVNSGDEIIVYLPIKAETSVKLESIPLDIIFEDEDVIVINKSAGMVVHPAIGNQSGTLVNALLAHTKGGLSQMGGGERPGIVHRIDKDTSGLLVCAKSDLAFVGLAEQFKDHSVEREYEALVYGWPTYNNPRLLGLTGFSSEPANVMKISTQLDRHRTHRKKRAVVKVGGRHAVTRIKVIEHYGNPPAVSRVTCWLDTGRTHQIRVHLAYIGHGLIGDQVYGSRQLSPGKFSCSITEKTIMEFPRQALHARVLGFVHPVKRSKMRFEAQVPSDMKQLLLNLSGSASSNAHACDNNEIFLQ
ncbi:MAG: pseudouridine synthase [Aestuariivita sp.]|nr:pseudouridine synthase [Aestuariivita sp.]